jgi:hypothetical protein
VQEYVTTIQQHIAVIQMVFYVNCKHLQSQIQHFGGQLIWHTRNGEKRVIQGLSEPNDGARKVRRLSAIFMKLCVGSLKRLAYKLRIRTFYRNFLL